jgi:hypothetical protein
VFQRGDVLLELVDRRSTDETDEIRLVTGVAGLKLAGDAVLADGKLIDAIRHQLAGSGVVHSSGCCPSECAIINIWRRRPHHDASSAVASLV